MRPLKKLAGAFLASAMMLGALLTPVMNVSAQTDAAKLQAEVLEWETAQTGGKKLLSGSLLEAAGTGSSDWTAFGYVRDGGTDGLAEYLGQMKVMVESVYKKIEAGETLGINPSELCRFAIIVKALGENPEAFGKDSSGNDINLIKDSAFDCVLGDVGKQGNNGYIWALLAMDSAKYEAPEGSTETRESLIQKLVSSQNEDGGFGLTKADASDVDMTAMTLTALAPYKDTNDAVKATADKAFAWLAAVQMDDATMTSYEERNTESICWTIIACAAWGKDINTEFVKNGVTLVDALTLFQLEDGSMIHSIDAKEPETKGNIMASYQTVYALEALERAQEGKPALFDLSDAPKVTAKEEKGGLPIGLIAGIGGGVAVLIILVVVLGGKKGGRKTEKKEPVKKGKTSGKKSDWDDDEDDEW